MRLSMMISCTTLVLAAGLWLPGCADAPFSGGSAEPAPDRVLSRIDDLQSRPDWLKESEPFVVDSDRVVSLGGTEIPAGHRIDAAYRIAENNAEASIAGAIEKKLEYIFQNAEEGTGFDGTQARYIGAEATRLLTSSLRPGKHYWEKVVYAPDLGRLAVKYRVFATVEMPQEDFKEAILNAVRRASGKGGLSADFAEKVNSQWDRFTAPAPVVPGSAPGPVPASAGPAAK